MIPGNPNASVAIYAGAVTVVLQWAAATWGGVDITAAVAAAITTLVTGLILLIGKRGNPN